MSDPVMPRKTLREIKRYLLTSGEAGADLGSGIERILVCDGWVGEIAGKSTIIDYPKGRSKYARTLVAILRRMYWAGNEWDADLGTDLERTLDIERNENDGLPSAGALAGAAAGALVAGPIGAVIGGVAGYFFGEDEKPRERYRAEPHARIAGYYVIFDNQARAPFNVVTEARSREEALSWTSDIREER